MPRTNRLADVAQLARAAAAPSPAARTKAKGEVVGITLRLTRQQWRRVHELALERGLSINALAIAGLGRLLADDGLPPL